MYSIQLSTFGFGPFFERQLQSLSGSRIAARIAAEHRGSYEVWSEHGSGRAQLTGKLRLELEEVGHPGVGDWVTVKDAPTPDHMTLIERVLTRRTVFTRGMAGREARPQIVAANVDLVFVVCGLDSDFNLRRIERYLARVWASGAQPAVVLNKTDICGDLESHLSEVESRCAGVPIHVTSALHAQGVEALREEIRDGQTVALVGSSGAGKSTLVNALIGEERMRTGEVRASDGRGCHVTTHRQLVILPGGGLLLDTPGMRELQLVDDEGLNDVFGDISEIASRCRYHDCRHDTEPGCAVKEAIASGSLNIERFEHYQQLEREARSYEIRHDQRRRRQAERVWGQLKDEVARLRKWKGGKP